MLMCKFDLAETCLKQSLDITIRNGATGGEAVMLPIISLIAYMSCKAAQTTLNGCKDVYTEYAYRQ